ncbi:MAG TPA: hypothetical protein VJ351_10980 [Streptosporangiaceae bacterium]|nr:hypothetical protein [Streptosporangiaceae bacterium]
MALTRSLRVLLVFVCALVLVDTLFFAALTPLLPHYTYVAHLSKSGAGILVAADLISDTCGFAVPFMDYQGERTLHSDYFGRKTDDQFAAYCASRPHNAVSLDGLPALPLPLPARSS